LSTFDAPSGQSCGLEDKTKVLNKYSVSSTEFNPKIQ
jgi:hypothetical protein